MAKWLGSQCFAQVGPFEWLGHGAIVVFDKGQDLGFQIGQGDEVTSAKQLTSQNAEPDFDLIHPGSMFGCVVEDNAMGQVGQECGPSCHGCKHARVALDAQIIVNIRLVGDETHQRLRLVGVEVVNHEMPLGDQGIGGNGLFNMSKKISLGARAAAGTNSDLPRYHIKVNDHR